VTDHSTRSAAVLFTRALQRVDQVEPESLRGPIIAMLAAGIELCASSRSLLGKPVNNLIDLAEALTLSTDDGV